MTHPLTDEVCENICQNYDSFSSQTKIWLKSMRSAYDKGRNDQLEQVIEWLKENLTWIEENGSARYLSLIDRIDEERITDDLKKAMRPQQQEDD